MKQKNILKSLLYSGIVIFWSFIYYKILYNTSYFVSIDDAGTKTLRLFLQNIIVNIPVIIMIIVALKQRKKRWYIYMNIPSGELPKVILLILSVIYAFLYIYAINIMDNIITASYMAIFYLIFVSFTEEFLYRGVLPSLLKNNSKILKLLLPNILFAFAHIIMLFVYNDPIKILATSGIQIIISLSTSIIFGIIMELLKRKSKSIYISVLLHAIYDYYGEIMLWL